VSLSATLRQRGSRRIGDGGAQRRDGRRCVPGGEPLSGFAHDVLAAQLAVGLENDGAISTFTAGGRSGEAVQVVPGVTVGDEPARVQRARIPPGAANTARARWRGSLEYRIAAVRTGARVASAAVLLGKTSVTVFGRMARRRGVRCRVGCCQSVCDAQDAQRRLRASWARSSTSIRRYSTTCRTGFAWAWPVPTSNGAAYGASPVDFYVTFGLPF